MACATWILPRMPTFMQGSIAWFSEQEACKMGENYEESEYCIAAIF